LALHDWEGIVGDGGVDGEPFLRNSGGEQDREEQYWAEEENQVQGTPEVKANRELAGCRASPGRTAESLP
jgi:hypothetical protein